MRFLQFMIVSFAVFTTALFGSCTSKEGSGEEPESPTTTSYKVRVKISTGEYTRAGDDAAVNTLHLAFYNGEECLGIVEATKDNDAYVCVIPAEYGKPDGVIAFANLPADDLPTKDNVMTKTYSNFWNGDNMIMSSARYFDASGNDKLKTPLTTMNLIEGGDAINIALDRIVAKVTVVKGTSDTYIGSVKVKRSGTETDLQLSIINWGVSAVEKGSYLVKNFGTDKTDIDNELNGWKDWNSTSSKLSHWAHSVTWENSNYPSLTYDNNDYPLSYASIASCGLTLDSQVYCHETTRSCEAYKINNALATIILIGRYSINTNSETFCIMKKDDQLQYYSDAAMKNEMVSRQTILYYNRKPVSDGSGFDLKHPEWATNIPQNYVTLQLSTNLINNIGMYTDVNDNQWDSSKADNINKALAEECGYVERFENGKCYFIVPIRNNLEATNPDEVTGSYGLVRNHHYKITVNSIMGLGSGLVDSDSFVPLKYSYSAQSSMQYKVNANVSVNEWQDVNQTVDIPKN